MNNSWRYNDQEFYNFLKDKMDSTFDSINMGVGSIQFVGVGIIAVKLIIVN
jgi:hypothetical protein